MSRTRVCHGESPEITACENHGTQSSALRAAANVVRGKEIQGKLVHVVETWFDTEAESWTAHVIANREGWDY